MQKEIHEGSRGSFLETIGLDREGMTWKEAMRLFGERLPRAERVGFFPDTLARYRNMQ